MGIVLRRGPHELRIVWTDEVLHFPSPSAAQTFLRPFMADPANRAAARQALVDWGRRELTRWTDAEVVEELAGRVGRGEVYVLAGPNRYGFTGPDRGIPPVAAEGEVSAQEVAEAAPEEKTWLEIELVDDDGDPVPGEQYAITLPGGAIRLGRLDENGRARLEGLDPGSCKVSFPNLHAPSWKFVKKA